MNKQIISAFMATMILTPATLWAGCITEDRGSPHGEQPKYNRTDMIADRIDNPWRDFYWRGRDYGQAIQCDPFSPDNCTYRWDQNYSASTQWGIGGGASAGTGGATWWAKAARFIIPTFNATYQQETIKISIFGLSAPFRAGQWAEPVMVQDRQWKSGYFRGGWVFTHNTFSGKGNGTKNWCYSYDDNARFGHWGTHAKVGQPYRTVVLHNSRP